LTGTATSNIPTSALGSGTADGTTFLRGDRTFQPIPVSATTENVLSATANASVGALGTYGFFRSISINAPGDTRAGSALRYSSLWDTRGGPSTTAPDGTWRCMGQVATTSEMVTVWLRIS
jgi:hypothetical protein